MPMVAMEKKFVIVFVLDFENLHGFFELFPLEEADDEENTTRTLVVVLSALITAWCGK